MRFWRQPEQYAPGDDAAGACDRAVESVRGKADRNERLARAATWIMVGAGALIPVCIVISTEGGRFWWGQLLPGVLGAVTAVMAGVLQFEKPHERWRFYRGYQRALETERLRYKNGSGPYAGLNEKEAQSLLVETLIRLQHEGHQDWSGILPASGDVAAGAARATTPAGPASNA